MIDDVVITSIIKSKNKYKVTTNREVYVIDEDIIIKYKIFKDSIFSREKFDQILEEENTSVLFGKALKYLSYQPRSQAEIRDYLKERYADFEQIEFIINKLVSYGYLNDVDYANSMFDYTINNFKGPHLLEQKLKQKEVEENILIQTLLKYDYYLEKEVILKAINKQIAKNNLLPEKKQKINLYQKLVRDGFNTELINEVISQTTFQDESNETLKSEIIKLANKFSNLSEYKMRNKIISNLINKGYEYSQILLIINKDE